MKAILGLDVGATTLAAGFVTLDGHVLHAVQRPTHADGAGTAVKGLLGLVETMVAEAGRRDLTLEAVGIGLPGAIDPMLGTMLAPPCNLVPEFRDIPLVEEVQRMTGLPTFVDNDANALALAEWRFGEARGSRSLVLFAIGTEVGGGLILDGALVRGAHGFAGELHGLVVNLDGERCQCGSRGCLGSYVAGRALAGEAQRQLAAGAPSVVLALAGGDVEAVTALHVFQAAAAGDAMAGGLVDRACAALGAGIASVINSLNPDVVVVTGGVAQSLAPLADTVRRHAADYALPASFARTRIHVIGCDKRSSVRGGAAVVLHHRVSTPAARG